MQPQATSPPVQNEDVNAGNAPMNPAPARLKIVPTYMAATTKQDSAQKIRPLVLLASNDEMLAEFMIAEFKSELQEVAINTVATRPHSLAKDGTIKPTEKKHPDARSWCAETLLRFMNELRPLVTLDVALRLKVVAGLMNNDDKLLKRFQSHGAYERKISKQLYVDNATDGNERKWSVHAAAHAVGAGLPILIFTVDNVLRIPRAADPQSADLSIFHCQGLCNMEPQGWWIDQTFNEDIGQPQDDLPAAERADWSFPMDARFGTSKAVYWFARPETTRHKMSYFVARALMLRLIMCHDQASSVVAREALETLAGAGLTPASVVECFGHNPSALAWVIAAHLRPCTGKQHGDALLYNIASVFYPYLVRSWATQWVKITDKYFKVGARNLFKRTAGMAAGTDAASLELALPTEFEF